MKPDLLSPYGEGYCGRCQFIVGLDQDGDLEAHWRGRHLDHRGVGSLCPGSFRPPWKRTPYSCRKNAFGFEAPKTQCPVCGLPTAIVHSMIAGDRLKRHWPPSLPAKLIWCTGSNQLVVGGRVVLPVSR